MHLHLALLHLEKSGHGSTCFFTEFATSLCTHAPFANASPFWVANTALLLNEVSEKRCKFWNEVSEISAEICLEIRPEVFGAFLAGRKVVPQNLTRYSHQRFQISKQISPKNFTTHFCRHVNPNELLGGAIQSTTRGPSVVRVSILLATLYNFYLKLQTGLLLLPLSSIGACEAVILARGAGVSDYFRRVLLSCSSRRVNNTQGVPKPLACQIASSGDFQN